MAVSMPSVGLAPVSVCCAEGAQPATAIWSSTRVSVSSDSSTRLRATQNLSWTRNAAPSLCLSSQNFRTRPTLSLDRSEKGSPQNVSSPSCSSSSPVRVTRAVRSGRQSLASSSWRGGKKRLVSVCKSVDVDDSAAAESVDVDDSAAAEGASAEKADELIKEATEELQKELDPRKDLEERYLVINSGKSECRSCGYVYESEKGDSNYPIAGGTAFSDLPTDWRCPTCGASQSYFQTKGVEVAGFVQNQSYGLGGNSLTEGQKSLLIYGSLVAFFALFLSGYLLQ